MLLLFVNHAKVIHHVEERGAFIGENAKGTHGEIYKSYTSVISAHNNNNNNNNNLLHVTPLHQMYGLLPSSWLIS